MVHFRHVLEELNLTWPPSPPSRRNPFRDYIKPSSTSALRFCMEGPFPLTVSGVPASNALSVRAALERSGKIIRYADLQELATEMGMPLDLFRDLSALDIQRQPFESKIASFKRLDDLCETWVADPKLSAAFEAWKPLALATFNKLADVKDLVEHHAHAKSDQKDKIEAALHAAVQRLSIEEEAARVVCVDKKSERLGQPRSC